MQPDSASAIQQIAIPRFTAEAPQPNVAPDHEPMLNDTAASVQLTLYVSGLCA